MGDLHFDQEPPQIYLAVAKGGSDGFVPVLPALAQELRTFLAGRKQGYLFESNRHDKWVETSSGTESSAISSSFLDNIYNERVSSRYGTH